MPHNNDYNGPIPDEIRKTLLYNSPAHYYHVFLTTAERNFTRRCQEILRSLCVWRQYAAYPMAIKNRMLDTLSNALFQARGSAIESHDLLQLEKASASAVMALPIRTV